MEQVTMVYTLDSKLKYAVTMQEGAEKLYRWLPREEYIMYYLGGKEDIRTDCNGEKWLRLRRVEMEECVDEFVQRVCATVNFHVRKNAGLFPDRMGI